MDQVTSRRDLNDAVYRLDRFDVEVRGRWREFTGSLLVFAFFFLAQVPLRIEAMKDPGSTPYLAPVVSLRTSLLLDVAFIVSYVVVAYRAWGLVRAFRAPRPFATINRGVAYLVIPGLALLDAAEDVYLWVSYTDNEEVTRLGWGPSQMMLLLAVAATLLLSSLIALVTDPRRHWDRHGDALELKPHRPQWLDGDHIELERWKGAMASRADDGSCTCDGTLTSPPDAPVERDWGVICCSGGGVRSAAFSLGALQTLNDKGIYAKANAVVGVSGGGYTSAAYHVMRWQSGDGTQKGVAHDKVWDLAPEQVFAPESPELHWVRRHTHYVLDSMRVAVQGALALSFGIAANLILLAVAIGATAWFLAWLALASRTVTLPDSGFTSAQDPGSSIRIDLGGDWWTLHHLWVVPAAGLVLFVLERAWDRFLTVSHAWRTGLRAVSTGLLTAGAVLYLLFYGMPALVVALFDYADTSGSSYARLIYSLGVVPMEHCDAVLRAGAAAACGEKTGMMAATTGVGAASVVTIVTSILAVLASVRGAAKSSGDGSGMTGLLKKVWARIKDPVVPWLAVTVIAVVCLGQLIRWTAALMTRPDRLDDWRYAVWAAGALIGLKLLSEPNRTSLHHFFRERIAYAFLVRRRFGKIESLPYGEPLRFSRSRPSTAKGPRLVTCAVANATDPTLVPAQRGCTPFVFDDEAIGLTDRLLPRQAARRGSAAYEFAADYRHRDATIPAAVAMSAAAFSPLAGRENVRLGPYRAVLALGNARLGVWLPNPLWADYASLARRQAALRDRDFAATWNRLSCQDASLTWKRLRSAQPWARWVCEAVEAGIPVRHRGLWRDTPARDVPRPRWATSRELGRTVLKKPGMTRVLREAVGRASIYDRFLYVTDGGHYDNLGLIEALRRRPRRIFAIDASNDPENTFRALGLAVATARMDLDCELQMDPRPMRRLKDQRSAAGWCTGTATFRDGTTCAIYLVKAIMIDKMPWDVETYAASNLDFPRTSTGKQLYSEFDFEAYRMLGVRAAGELLEAAGYVDQETALAGEESAEGSEEGAAERTAAEESARDAAAAVGSNGVHERRRHRVPGQR